MGEARRRQVSDQAFKKLHKVCAYCGKPSTTIDHFPPRAFFRQRVWPEDFRFPSCERCNSGTSHEELVVAALARMRLDGVEDDPYTLHLLQAIKNNRLDVMKEWLEPVSRNDARKRLRQTFGNEVGDEMRRNGFSMVYYGDKTQRCMQAFGEKLIKALYFKHSGRPLEGALECLPFSVLENRGLMEVAVSHAPHLQETKRQNVELSDQFAYRLNADVDFKVMFLVAQLGNQLGFIGHALTREFCDDLAVSNPDELREISNFYATALAKSRLSSVL